MEYKGRSSGGNAGRSSAYNSCGVVVSAHGETFDYRNKGKATDIHLGVLLPEGAPERYRNPEALWQAAEAAEKRKDSQVAREWVLALPKDLGRDDWVALARRFAEEHCLRHGLPAQIDIHADPKNPHVHILTTTRRLGPEGLAKIKARDIDPTVATTKTGGRMVDGDRWGRVWAEMQNRFFAEQGLDLRVDPTRAVAEPHLGERGKRGADTAPGRTARAEAQAEDATAWRDPVRILDVMTRDQATFRARDLDRALKARIADQGERAAVRAAVLASPEIVAMHDPRTGKPLGRYTTQTVLAEERRIVSNAAALAADRERHRPAPLAVGRALPASATAEQRAFYHHILNSGGLAIGLGRAGTGKSFTAGAAVQALRESGFDVVLVAPTNAVAKDWEASQPVSRAATIHSELWHVENKKRGWSPKTVVIADEAAMLGNSHLDRLLDAARKAGAKVVLIGDDRQLASISRTGMMTELVERCGAAELTGVYRQRVAWQAHAAEDLAGGRVKDAIRAYQSHGAITWANTKDDAVGALIAKWTGDTAARPDKTRFVIAHTNDDVRALNSACRAIRAERGEIGHDVMLPSEGEARPFAVGDRVQIIETDKEKGLFNGEVGTVESIRNGRITLMLDAGRRTEINTAEFEGYRHGYAGTIYKSQGRTIDETYVLHSKYCRQESMYVGLTRQRDDCQVFVGRDQAESLDRLITQCSREDGRRAAISYDTPRVGRQVEQALELVGRADLDDARKFQIEDRIIAYLEARQEAGELWADIRPGNRDPEDHPSYTAFLQAQGARDGAVRALVADPIATRVGAHIIDAKDIAADHLMATGAKTRQEAIDCAWTHALALGLREQTPLERLPGLAEAYRQAEAAGTSQQYDLYRDLGTTLARVDAGELRLAPRQVQDLVHHLRTERAAEQEAQERSHGMSL